MELFARIERIIPGGRRQPVLAVAEVFDLSVPQVGDRLVVLELERPVAVSVGFIVGEDHLRGMS